jgi:nucleotide-binding universal stress UspA family protein
MTGTQCAFGEAGVRPVNRLETIQSKRTAAARLFQEYDAEDGDTGDVLHGIAFEDERVFVAGGRFLLRLAPDSGRVIDRLETWPDAGGFAFDGRRFWQRSAGQLQQLDLRTGLVVRSVSPALHDVTGLACFENHLLVLHAEGRRLTRIRVEEHAFYNQAVVIWEAETSAPLRGLTWAGGELWSSVDGAFVRVDPGTARILERLALPDGAELCDVAADSLGRFWCVDGHGRKVRVYARPDGPGGDRESLRYAQAPPSSRVVDVSTKPLPAGVAVAVPPESVNGPTFDRILVPIDFSAASRRALATALLLQDRLRSEVHLFHLAEQGANAAFLAGSGASVSSSDLAVDAEARLRRFVENVFPGRGAGVAVHARVGTDVVRAIEGAAKEIGATIVILTGGHRQTMFRTHVEQIARGLSTAVMELRTE